MSALNGSLPLSSSSLKTPSPDEKRPFDLADCSTYQEWRHKKYKDDPSSKRSRSKSLPKILPSPKSQIQELQYIYEIFDHEACGVKHRRIDDCRKGLRHNLCGKRHSKFKNCDGSWLSLEKFEEVAWQIESVKKKAFSNKRSFEESSINNKPPISKLPELQYIYKKRFHKDCKKVHSRLDHCDTAPVHRDCGRKHGYAILCDGSWMSLPKFEAIALRWPSTMAYRKRLESQLLASNSNDSVSSPYSPPTTRHRNRQKMNRPTKQSERLKALCFDWNLKGTCEESRCSAIHKCSFMEIDNKHGDRVCWRRHREMDHNEWKKSILRYQSKGFM